MKRILQLLSALCLLGSTFLWLQTGANRGWTKTSVPIKTLDTVTGIEGIEYQRKFQPGVDFLGATLGGSALLAGLSLFFRKSNEQTKT